MPNRKPRQHQPNYPRDNREEDPINRSEVVIVEARTRGFGEELGVDEGAGNGEGEDAEEGGVDEE